MRHDSVDAHQNNIEHGSSCFAFCSYSNPFKWLAKRRAATPPQPPEKPNVKLPQSILVTSPAHPPTSSPEIEKTVATGRREATNPTLKAPLSIPLSEKKLPPPPILTPATSDATVTTASRGNKGNEKKRTRDSGSGEEHNGDKEKEKLRKEGKAGKFSEVGGQKGKGDEESTSQSDESDDRDFDSLASLKGEAGREGEDGETDSMSERSDDLD